MSEPAAGGGADLRFRVGFSFAPSIGAQRMQLIEQAFPSIAAAWDAPGAELIAAGLPERAAAERDAARARLDLDAELERLERVQVQALSWHDRRYPALLKQIYDPPPLLYVHGDPGPADGPGLAVVGTRSPSGYGRRVTARLSAELANAGFAVVSGLALGVDAAAHRAALDCGGRTIGVVAGGLDLISPQQHLPLAAAIVESGRGAVISEHPLGTEPATANFPRRNRILAGMTLGTLVTEAKMKSGAWHTVTAALDQGREVFAVPGPIDSERSEGTNSMLQQGLAKLVARAGDILEELPGAAREGQPRMPLSGAMRSDSTAASA